MDKLYLDTCIISALVKKDLDDMEENALIKILEMYQSGKIQLVTSSLTHDELKNIPEAYRRNHEIIYMLLNKVPISETSHLHGIIGSGIIPFQKEDPLVLKLRSILPDEVDQHHIFHAIKNNCDYFVTIDKKTILRYRNKIFLDIDEFMVMSPSDIVNMLSVEI